jgi:hypothetical protein
MAHADGISRSPFRRGDRKVRAASVDRYDALVLAERPVPADPEIAAARLAGAWLAGGPREEDTRSAAPFAGHDIDLDALVRRPPMEPRRTTCASLARSPEVAPSIATRRVAHRARGRPARLEHRRRQRRRR